MRRYLILALPLFVLALSPAHAEPKTITVEDCAKVTTEIVQSGERKSVTVTCTGEAHDPHVKQTSDILLNCRGYDIRNPGGCSSTPDRMLKPN